MLDLKRLAIETVWVSRIDPEFQLDVTGSALWAVFSAETPEGIPSHALDCTDVLTPEQMPVWTAWDDATPEQIEQARCFRWIVMSS
jgi:hypothetical protein